MSIGMAVLRSCSHAVPDTLRYRDFVPAIGGYSLAVMLSFGLGFRFPISVAEVARVILT